MKYAIHYTLEEARALLPDVRAWIERLQELNALLKTSERQIAALAAQDADVGGPLVNRSLQARHDFEHVLGEFARRQILIKDLDRGLIDFPAILEGREVFLCWEADEPDIEHWHDLDAGYAGREPL